MMFRELDEDKSNTLSMTEITALFKENGIHMSVKQVGEMFDSAMRMYFVR